MFYSAQSSGFYDTSTHGTRTITIIDPAWARPTVTLVLLPGESAWVGDELVANASDEPMTVRDVPDINAIPDILTVDNPDCLIPVDAVEISQERHAELLAGQSKGLVISSDKNGHPVLMDQPPPSDAELIAVERDWRSARLSATDSLVSRHRDELEEGGETSLTINQYASLQTYRRQLRDWPEQGEFPLSKHRPTSPLWLSEHLR